MSHPIVFGAGLPVICQALLQAGMRMLIQSSLLLLVSLFAGRALRRSGPARQLHVYQSTLGAVAFCIVLSLVLAGRLPAVCRLTLPSALADASSLPPLPTPAAGSRTSSWTPLSASDAPSAANGEQRDLAGQRIRVQVLSAPARFLNAVQPAAAPFSGFLQPEPARAISPMGRVYVVLAAVWLGGATLLLGWLGLCYAGITRICRRAQIIQDEELCEELASLCDAHDTTVPALRVSADVNSVFLVGIRHPSILLPSDYVDRFEPPTLSAVLAHEVTHLQTHEGIWTLMTRLLCVLLWPQPLLWRVGRLREQASEEVCDQAVVRQGYSPHTYADCLVTLAQRLSPGRFELVAGSGSVVFRSSLAQRVQKLMSGAWRHAVPVTPWFRAAVILGAVASSLLLVLAVSAAPVQTDNAMGNDSRLNQKVVVTAEGVPLGDLMESPPLSRAGKPLQAASLARTKAGPTVPGSPQRHPAAKPATSRGDLAEDASLRTLRLKLASLERLVVQDQAENRQMRLQLAQIQARQHPARATPALPRKPGDSRAEESSTLQMTLRDLKKQQTLLHASLEQAQLRYQNGVAPISSTFALQEQVNHNDLRVQSIHDELSDLNAGRKLSPKERQRRDLRRKLAELQGDMRTRRQTLQLAQAQYQAGGIAVTDLQAAQQNVAQLQVKIDDVLRHLLLLDTP